MVVGEVSIGSGSMSYTFYPLTGQRFSSSLSRNRVPCSSVQALPENRLRFLKGVQECSA